MGSPIATLPTLLNTWMLDWVSVDPAENCALGRDGDGDGLAGCADPDCDVQCAACGDGVCNPLESCRLCPADCGACPLVCGDFVCDPGETCSGCPGDCGGC